MASGLGLPRMVGVGFVIGLQASIEIEVTGLPGFGKTDWEARCTGGGLWTVT